MKRAVVPVTGTAANFYERWLRLTPADASPYVVDPGAMQAGLAATAGYHRYQIYVPSASSLAAMSWTGLPYRVLIVCHGDGERGLDGTKHVTNFGYDAIPALLGWGTAQDGSLRSVFQGWPLLTIFPQRPTPWTGDATSDNGGRGRRVMYNYIDYALNQTRDEFSIDTKRIYIAGFSGGGFIANQYIQERYRLGRPRNIAAGLMCSSSLANNYYEAQSGGTPWASEAAAAAAQAPTLFAAGPVPFRQFNGDADTQVPPSWCNQTPPAMAAAGYTSANYQQTVISGGTHTSTTTNAHAGMDPTADPWSWLLNFHL